MNAALPGLPADLSQLAPAQLKAALAQLDDLHCKMARKDPNAFMTYVLRDEESGQPILQSKIHQVWQQLIDQYRRVLIWSHVEAGKTNQVSIGRSIYELGKNQNLRVVVVSNTDGQAQKICLTVGKYITGSPQLARVFPGLQRDKGMPWTMHQLYVKRSSRAKDPSFQTCGIHGNILGARIDLLILDDLLDYENTLSQTQRNDLWNWFHATLEGRLTKNARVWCVGTAWHRDDFMHRISKTQSWKSVRFPVVDDKGNPTWPERWPAARIEEKRTILGPLEYSRQLLCVARSDEDARFKREWIDKCIARGEGKSMIAALAELPPGFSTYTGVDLGVRTKDGSDLTVLFTIAVHPNGDRQVLDCDSGRWSGPDIVKKIEEKHAAYRSIVIVENNAAQQFIVDFTKKTSAVPVRPYTTTGKVFRSYEFGMESMAVELANEKWIIPSRNGIVHPELDAWRTELLYYDPKTHPGDRLMASWFAREGAGQIKPKAQVGRIDLLRR